MKRRCILCGTPGGADADGWCGVCCMFHVVADEDTDDAPPPAPKARVVPLATAAKQRPPRIELELPTTLIGRMLGGITRGAAVLVYGPPGAGKTTDALGFACEIAEAARGRVLFVSGEMPAWRVADCARRAGGDVERVDVAMAIGGPMPELPALAPFAAVVLDSVNVLGQGNPRAMVAMLRDAIHAARRAGVVLVAVAHVDKAGAVKGPTDLAHDVDVQAEIAPKVARLVKTREDCRALEIERASVTPRRAARSSRRG